MFMHKYPFVKQINCNDCAVACLQMIIKYYKGYISLNELKNLTKTTSNGTTAYNLIGGAKLIGFDTKGYNCSFDNFNDSNVKTPFIAHVIIDNKYKHFIVVYEINFKTETMLIADPASKIIKITFDKFKQIYNNIIILLYPIKKIPLDYDYSIYKFVINIIKIFKKDLLLAISVSFIFDIFS